MQEDDIQPIPHRGKPAGFMTLTYAFSQVDKAVLNRLVNALMSINRKEGEKDDDYNARVLSAVAPIVIGDFYNVLPALLALDGQATKADLEKADMTQAVEWIKDIIEDNKSNWNAIQDFLVQGTQGKKANQESTK